jgi:hypothetical protein
LGEERIALISFGKRDDEMGGASEPNMAPPHNVNSPPTDHVIAMQQQGLSNSQIVEYLQRQGYPPEQVFEAMNQASVKGTVENMGQEMFDNGSNSMGNAPNMGPMSPPLQSPMEMGSYGGSSENVERVAEAIIEEKWNELTKHINKIIDWKDKTESRVTRMEQQFNDLRTSFESLHQALLGKVNEYDQNIVNLGVEIKAMEKVFQKILPTLTDNVTELSRITKDLKR